MPHPQRPDSSELARHRVRGLVDASEERAQRAREIGKRRKHDELRMVQVRLRERESEARLQAMLAAKRRFERRVIIEKLRDPWWWLSKIRPSHWFLFCAVAAFAFYLWFLRQIPPGILPYR